MDLRTLEAFLAICQYNNITKAAEHLHISQPALTRKMQELEKEIGCRLFNRGKKQIELTEGGYLFQIRAKEILQIANQTKREVSEGGDFLSGTVKVGCVESAVSKLLAKVTKGFKSKYPHVQFEFYAADGDDIKTAIDANKLDMGLLIEPVETAKYQHISLPVSERWGVVATEKFIGKDKQFLTYPELTQYPLIVPRRYIVLDEICSWLNVKASELNIAASNNLVSNSLDQLEEGLGILLCIEGAFTNRERSGMRFIPLKPERSSSHILIRKKNRPLAKQSELFWKEFQEINSGN